MDSDTRKNKIYSINLRISKTIGFTTTEEVLCLIMIDSVILSFVNVFWLRTTRGDQFQSAIDLMDELQGVMMLP